MQIQNAKQGYKLVKSIYRKYEEIPQDWNFKQLKEIGQLVGGGTPDSTISEYWNGDILWAVPTDITNLSSNIIKDTSRKITEKGLNESSAKLLSVGTILITSRATIGECAINTKPMATNQGFQSLTCNEENDNLFIFYAVKFHKKRILRLSYGTTFLEISKNEMKKVSIPTPESIKEQQKIASIISNVDSLIQQTQKIIEQTQILKKGLMQKLFTKGIGHTKFKKTDFSYNPYRLSTVPENWDYIKLGETGDFINGLNKEKEDYGYGCLHVNIDNIFEGFEIDLTKLGRVNATDKEIMRYKLEKKDILLLRSSVKLEGVGYPALFSGSKDPVVFSGFIIRFRPNQTIWNPVFLTHLLRTDFVRWNAKALATVSANVNINQESYKTIPLPCPPLKEQEQITSIITNLDSKIGWLTESKSNILKLKKGLMQKLLTGKIRVKV